MTLGEKDKQHWGFWWTSPNPLDSDSDHLFWAILMLINNRWLQPRGLWHPIMSQGIWKQLFPCIRIPNVCPSSAPLGCYTNRCIMKVHIWVWYILWGFSFLSKNGLHAFIIIQSCTQWRLSDIMSLDALTSAI